MAQPKKHPDPPTPESLIARAIWGLAKTMKDQPERAAHYSTIVRNLSALVDKVSVEPQESHE